MSKRILMLAVAVLALAIAVPSFAAVQNVKVSGDLSVQGVSRYDFTLQRAKSPTVVTASTMADNQNAILSIARLKVDAELTDNVSAVVRLLSERLWDEDTAAATQIDLDLAYATLKEFLYSPLTLTVGRQELHFGNDLIIGDPDTNGLASAASALTTTAGTVTDLGDLSARKAFDAIRATLNYTVSDQPLAVDLLYAKIDENLNNRNDDVNLYGVNANYPVNENIATELYLWTRDRQPGSVTTTGALTPTQNEIKTERLHTLGGRGVYTGITNLTLQGEAAWQFGNKLIDTATVANLMTTVTNINANPDGLRIEDSFVKANAWALQLIGSYAFPEVRHTPNIGVSYTHLSGEKSNSTRDWNGWDAMYENQAGGTIFNKILGYSNVDLINVNASLKPDFIDDLTVKFDWYHIILDVPLATQNNNSYIISGVVGGQTYKVGTDKNLGDEIDLGLTYDYTEDVQLGLNAGWFIPGDTFYSSDMDHVASQAIASMKVIF
ncbi:MAG: alginate export family protein [Candidatus Omnitrophota bacterium]